MRTMNIMKTFDVCFLCILLLSCKDVETTKTEALFRAVRDSDMPTVVRLLDEGVNVNAKKDGEWTPIHLASDNGDVKMVMLLIKRGADIDAFVPGFGTPLWNAGNISTFQFLLESGANPNIPCRIGDNWRPVMGYALCDQTNKLELILKYGADVNAINSEGKTALDYAIAESHTNAIALLRDSGARTGAELRSMPHNDGNNVE